MTFYCVAKANVDPHPPMIVWLLVLFGPEQGALKCIIEGLK